MENWVNEDLGYLMEAVGKKIQIERGGPDKLEGILLNVQGDCLNVLTNNGVVYVKAEHMKTITLALVAGNEEGAVEGEQEERTYETIPGNNFYEVVESLKHRLVKINQGGPNSLQGVLLEVRPEAVTMIHQMKEYVHFPIYHIKSISLVTENKNENKDENKDQNKNEAKEVRSEERDERRVAWGRDREERKSSRSSKRSSSGKRSKSYSQSWPVRFGE